MQTVYTTNPCIECGTGSKVLRRFNGEGALCKTHQTYEMAVKHRKIRIGAWRKKQKEKKKEGKKK